jgi:hypothetical protein
MPPQYECQACWPSESNSVSARFPHDGFRSVGILPALCFFLELEDCRQDASAT